jgi:hypothetical protein
MKENEQMLARPDAPVSEAAGIEGLQARSFVLFALGLQCVMNEQSGRRLVTAAAAVLACWVFKSLETPTLPRTSTKFLLH